MMVIGGLVVNADHLSFVDLKIMLKSKLGHNVLLVLDFPAAFSGMKSPEGIQDKSNATFPHLGPD